MYPTRLEGPGLKKSYQKISLVPDTTQSQILAKPMSFQTSLIKALETVGYTRLNKSLKNFKCLLCSSQFSQLPDLGPDPKINTRN